MAGGVPSVGARVPVTGRAGARACRAFGGLLLALAVAASSRAARAQAPAGLVHEAVTSAKRGTTLVITVGVNGLKFDKLVLAYRPEGEVEFHGREMKVGSEGTYRSEIPPQATLGDTVDYYIEAQDKDGTPVAGRASAQSPLVVRLVGDAPASVVSKAGGGGGEDEDDGGLLGERRVFVALLAGTGAGWAKGDGDTNADTMYGSSVARARLGQLVPEIGYWLNPTLMISVQGRFQIVTGTTDVYADGRIYHTANYAAAGFLKATWLAAPAARAHPFFSLAGGVGEIRHVVTFPLETCGPTGKQACVDTIATGPVALGPGVGLFVDLGPHLVGVLELDSQLTLPAYSINVDGNFGLAARF